MNPVALNEVDGMIDLSAIFAVSGMKQARDETLVCLLVSVTGL
jgi:hypothetical protein